SAPLPARTCALSLHDALPIFGTGDDLAPVLVAVRLEHGVGLLALEDRAARLVARELERAVEERLVLEDAVDLDPARRGEHHLRRSEEHTSELQSRVELVCRLL